MTSELRPAALVAHEVCEEMEEYGPTFAERVIEADRKAVRAPLLAEIERLTIQLEVESEPSPYCPICGSCGEDGCCGPQRCLYPTTEQAAELAKWNALAETLAGALGKIAPIRVHNGPDYAEVYFADGKTHATQAMTMNPQDWIDLSEALRQYKEARDER